jgi:DNA-binding NtrC family response regulator
MNVILIVDDEAAVREVLGRWLTAAGYETREAETAEAALEVMARACADVVMCDVEMPGEGGLWMAEQLRERYPTTAMVLATALDSVPPATSLKSGIVQYLVKPFQRESVLSAIATGVKWHAAAVERSLGAPASRESLDTWLASLPGTPEP